MGCWFSNHPPKENMQSYCKSKALKNFMAFLDNSDRIEDNEKQLADAIGDIEAHFIRINTKAGKKAPDESGPDSNEDASLI